MNTIHLDRLAHQLTTTVASALDPHGRYDDPAAVRLHRIRRLVVVGGALATAVQIVVWLLIGILGPGLDAPWWLWTAVPCALATFALTAAVGLPPSWYGSHLPSR